VKTIVSFMFCGLAYCLTSCSREAPDNVTARAGPPASKTPDKLVKTGTPAKFKRQENFTTHVVLGPMDATYVEGGQPYLTTKKLALGSLPFQSAVTIWTDPEHPSDLAISSAINLIRSGDDFRAEVEKRFFDDYVQVTRVEYLEYAQDPAYGITPEMLPELRSPSEIWSILRPLEEAVSVSERHEERPWSGIELTLSFSAAFDREHDFHITFRNGKFYEITR
jgi:hypothetical protein